MILQRIRIIVVDARFEPGTSAPEVWCATNEPPHLQMSHHIYNGNTVALLPYKFASISHVCFVLPGFNMSQLDDRHVLPAVEMS